MEADIYFLIKIFCIIFGLMVGSFLNVVVYRIPREKSVVFPPSSCTHCEHKIKWYENIPVASYLILGGKCSNCKSKISLRYPLMELTVGIISGLLAPRYLDVNTIILFFFNFSIACIFLSHFLIDIEFQILPDKINLYFLAIALPFAIIYFPLEYWLVGGAIGFLGPFLVTYLFYKLRGQIGLGGGDIKLYGILGLLLGPFGVLNTIFLSCMFGAVVGIIMILLKKMQKDTPLPFGPFILIVAAIQIFLPELGKLMTLIP